jgi:hypothetical protein
MDIRQIILFPMDVYDDFFNIYDIHYNVNSFNYIAYLFT